MTICNQLNLKLDEMDNKVTDRIQEGVIVTSDGEFLAETQEVLKIAREATRPFEVKKILVDHINKNNFYKIVQNKISQRIQVRIRNKSAKYFTKKPTAMTLVDVSLQGDFAVVKFKTDSGKFYSYTYDTTDSSDMSLPSSDGHVVTIFGMGTALVSAKSQIASLMKAYDKEVEKTIGMKNPTATNALADIRAMLASTDDVLDQPKDTTSFVEEQNHTHGNIEDMQNLLQKLHDNGHFKASPEYLEHAKRLIGSMHPHFFHKMSVFIKQHAQDNAGWVSIDPAIMGIELAAPNTTKKIHMSEAEVYLHEVLHTMTAWALRSDDVKAAKIKRKIQHLMRKTLEQTTWKDFLAVDEATANQEDINRAKAIYAYMFTGQNSVEEFMVYGLSNPAVMKHFQNIRLKEDPQTVMEKIVNFFHTIMDIVLGNYSFGEDNKNVNDNLIALATQLGEINNKASDLANQRNITQSINDWVDNRNDEISKLIEKISTKFFDPNAPYVPMSQNAGPIERAKYVTSFLMKAITNKSYGQVVGLLASSYWMKPESSIREFFATQVEESEAKKNANWLGLLTNRIDGLRNSVIETTGSSILKAFHRPLSEEQESNITKVLIDTNATRLLYGDTPLTRDDFVNLLRNSRVLRTKINESKQKISAMLTDPARRNWTIAQAEGLGYYMTTNIGVPVQNLNSNNIVKGIQFTSRFAPDEALRNEVEELASLTALLHTASDKKESVANIAEQQFDGVKNIANIYEAFKASSQSLFEQDDVHMIEGYSKELLDDTIEIKFAPISQRADLATDGYEFSHRIYPKNGLNHKEPMAIYVTASYSKAERQRGTLSLNAITAKGSSLKEQKFVEDPVLGGRNFMRDRAIVERSGAAITAQMINGTYDPTKQEGGMVATLDVNGGVSDYRYIMNKEQKEAILKQDTRVSAVLSRSMGTVVDKHLRKDHNAKVLEEIKNNMDENWTNGELGDDLLTEYRLIGPNSTDPKMKELYYALPNEFRLFIDNRPDKTMAIPAELMNIYFGYRHLKFTDIPGINALPVQFKKILDMFESYYIDLIKIVKGTILLKMPQVLVTNIVSNLWLMFTFQLNPVEIFKNYSESFRDVKAYISDHKKANQLEIEIASLKQEMRSAVDKNAVKEKIFAKETEVKMLHEKLASNPIKELIDLGMSQAVVDDVNTVELRDTNKVSEGLDKLLANVPSVIKTPAQWLYLSKETAWYKINQEVLQMSDLVARDVLNRRLKNKEVRQANGEINLPQEYLDFVKEKYGFDIPKKKELSGPEREEFFKEVGKARQYTLLKMFINYTQPNGRFEEYLNRVGLLMFTKYIKNIQRVLFTSSKKHPINTLLTLILGGWMINSDISQDQSFLARGFDHHGNFSVGNIFPVYNPIDNLMTAVNPPLINLVH